MPQWKWTTPDEASREEARYWLSRPVSERLAAVEALRRLTWGSTVTLPPEWSEFIGLLCGARVRFLIVGAHALAVHGRPRATGDLDTLVEPTPANAARLARALGQFGFATLARQG